MYQVSARLEETLHAVHRIYNRVTATAPGKAPLEVAFKGGDVTVDPSSQVRRKCSLQVVGSPETFELIATPGTLFEVDHGVLVDQTQEWHRLFTGTLVGDAEQPIGESAITLPLADYGHKLSYRFVSPFLAASGTKRVDIITSAVQYARPGTTVLDLSTDAGTVHAPIVWTESVGDLIGDLSTDGGTDGYFRPDGTFVIVDRPTVSDEAVWTIASGEGGLLKSGSRTRPFDRLYNTVVVRPSASDGSQTWTQQIVQVADINHPRHPSKTGVVPYFWSSPTIQNAAGAVAAGQKILDRVLGVTTSLSLDTVLHPGLEGYDVIRAALPHLNSAPGETYTHSVDGIRFSLATGGMSLTTRSQGVIDEQS
jgi:hypothetical protein